jgi:hypothetical protein
LGRRQLGRALQRGLGFIVFHGPGRRGSMARRDLGFGLVDRFQAVDSSTMRGEILFRTNAEFDRLIQRRGAQGKNNARGTPVRTLLQWLARRSRAVFAGGFPLYAVSTSLFFLFVGPQTASLCGDEEGIPHRRPVVVLVEEDPWLDLIGSDMPRLVIYDDGTIIFRWMSKPVSNPPSYESYKQAILSKSEMKELFIKVNVTAFRQLKRFYNVTPNVTDMPTVDVYVYADGMEKMVSVYGFGSEREEPPTTDLPPDAPTPDVLPTQFRQVYSALVSLSPKPSEKWVPPELELVIQPSKYNKSRTPWPRGWPTLSDARTVKRENLYSLYMPGTRLKEVQAFLAAKKGAVTLDGKEWEVTILYPFPGKQTWDRAFRGGIAKSQNEQKRAEEVEKVKKQKR